MQFGSEFKRFVHVARESGGSMHVGSTDTYAYWSDEGRGLSTFPTVALVARRIGVFCLHVCDNERAFSISGYIDDSRKAKLTPMNFKNRVLIAVNGSTATLKQRLADSRRDGVGGGDVSDDDDE